MKNVETVKRECQVLARFKIAALKSGTRRELFSEFHKSSKLGYTNFTAGHYIEIVMAWMLGYFARIFSCYYGYSYECYNKLEG